jgi:hypothetical protein
MRNGTKLCIRNGTELCIRNGTESCIRNGTELRIRNGTTHSVRDCTFHNELWESRRPSTRPQPARDAKHHATFATSFMHIAFTSLICSLLYAAVWSIAVVSSQTCPDDAVVVDLDGESVGLQPASHGRSVSWFLRLDVCS